MVVSAGSASAARDPQAGAQPQVNADYAAPLFPAQHSGCRGRTPVNRIPIGFLAPYLAPRLDDPALELPAVDERKSIERPGAKLESHLTEGEFLSAGPLVARQFDQFFFR